MAITRSTLEARAGSDRPAWTLRGRRHERLLLLAACLPLLVGFYLVQRGVVELAAVEGAVDLNEIRQSDDLLPVLAPVFDDLDDRRFAARGLADFLQIDDELVGGRRYIERVGALRGARATEREIASRPGLGHYAQRLAQARAVWEQLGATEAERTIPLLTAAQYQSVAPRLTVRSPGAFRASFWLWAALFVGAFFVLHLALTLAAARGDEILLPVVLILTGVGFVMMTSLRDPLRDALLFRSYATGLLLGVPFCFALARVDFERTVWRRLAYVPLLLALLLSLVLLIFGSGPTGSAAKVNLVLGPLSVQPVEVVKILLVFFFAGYFAERWVFLRSMKAGRTEKALERLNPTGDVRTARRLERIGRFFDGFDRPHLAYIIPIFAAVGLTLLFFYFQKDLGPALIIACLFLSLYGVARGRWVAAGLGLGGLVAAFWISYVLGTPATVGQRIALWLHPWDNMLGWGGSHLAQGLWAFSAGGFAGTGPGLGMPEVISQAHTDFILAAIGEELGFVGVACMLGLYAVLIHRAFGIARRAPSVYTYFLALGIALLTAYQILLISGGVLGMLPLSGVISPFLNVGKSSMIANFALLGMLISISGASRTAPEAPTFHGAARKVLVVLGVLGALLLVKAAYVQLVVSDEVLLRGVRTVEADGVRRVRHNPRLLAAAERIPRGTIYDREGLPLAASDPEALRPFADRYAALGIRPDDLMQADGRLYPLGALTFHLLGDIDSWRNMAASNTAYIERDERTWLRGFDEWDELVPLVRHRHEPDHPGVKALLARERDLYLTLDAEMQRDLSDALATTIEAAGLERGAAVVLDAESGALLASATYPYAGRSQAALLDRPRYAVYPPGSTFKLVTAIAALQANPRADTTRYTAVYLPGGGVGARIRGWGRPIRDATDRTVGTMRMDRAIAMSSNAYFAQLGTYDVGADRLYRTLKRFGMDAGLPGEPDSTQVARLQDALPQAAIGQGSILARPIEVARVAATIANGGLLPYEHWVARGGSEPPPTPDRIIEPDQAELLASYMRDVVTQGTARSLASLDLPVYGKTGTAEVAEGRPHAWFTGFAPYDGGQRRLAFAIVIEHGGAGGRLAAQAAGDFLRASVLDD